MASMSSGGSVTVKSTSMAVTIQAGVVEPKALVAAAGVGDREQDVRVDAGAASVDPYGGRPAEAGGGSRCSGAR